MSLNLKALGLTHIFKGFHWSYLPPLMVYTAYGISGLTAIVGTFFVKDYLSLSAGFLASLGFWAGIPWALKMPVGHLVDLFWKYKSAIVIVGALLMASSLLIMLGLLANKEMMETYANAEWWFVLSALLAPTGYVLQDVVADAMTVEAVPTTNNSGKPLPQEEIKGSHITMQTLGRVAIVGGGLIVSLLNVFLFHDIPPEKMQETYIFIYKLALLIPIVSILGVALSFYIRYQRAQNLRKNNVSEKDISRILDTQQEKPKPNWWILGGSGLYVIFTITIGLSAIPFSEEIIFVGSLAIVAYLMSRLIKVLPQEKQIVLVATAIVIFVFRATPGPGAGASWWQIDVLGFDQAFLAKLGLIASTLALLGMLSLRTWMSKKSITYVVVFLSIVSSILSLPIIGMYYGLHEWTSEMTGGIVGARFIAVIDTALESPLGQVAMIPMLAWIANNAPSDMKATFFAVMASFTNLALSLGQLGTKYLNQIFTITREVKSSTGTIEIPQDYSELGTLFITITLINLSLPLLAVYILRKKTE
jgi:MFS family permease